MCARIFVSSNSKPLTPDFLYILAFEVKTDTHTTPTHPHPPPRFSNWIIQLNLKGQIKNHTNKYKIQEKFGHSSHSIFALVIAIGPGSEEQFSPLLLLLLFFSVFIWNCKATRELKINWMTVTHL